MAAENRRIRMTKALLNESFLKALEQKPLARITVKEICDDADVNRSTYYVYYSDPYDQLRKLEQELMDDQTSLVDSFLREYPTGDDGFQKTITKLLLYYREKKKMLQILLGRYGDVHLEYDMLSFFAQKMISSFAPGIQSSQEILQEYIFAATGCFGLIFYWIMQECQEPPEILAKRIARLTASIREVNF